MSERRPLVSGDIFAGRYELQDLVSEKLGSTSWRAHDSVLHRNVGLELLPSADPRAEHFLEAARMSTAVSDPRFLRILDLIEDDHGHHAIIREWARAFPLEALLQESPLPNRRAAEVVAEVAEALAHAHSRDLYHRRLTPHQVLLKQNGAVRVVGLGVATALAPVDRADSFANLAEYERLDVQALGKLLYACLVARWPGGNIDGLRAAPTEHGRLLRPRQVRAGVSREIDAVCQRILGGPGPYQPLTTAAAIADELRRVNRAPHRPSQLTSIADTSDLSRVDPVVVPAGPPPGLEPPRPRPKAFEPPPPTPVERGVARAKLAMQGDRKLVLLGIVGTLLIALTIAFLVGRSTVNQGGSRNPDDSGRTAQVLRIAGVDDFDPQGSDGSENPQQVELAHDGDAETGWRTSTYFRNRALGGIKDGVGLLIDLGGPRDVRTLRVQMAQATDVEIWASSPGADRPPGSLTDLQREVALLGAGPDATIAFASPVQTRYLVVWLTGLPEIADGQYQGEILELEVRGRT